MPYLLTMGPQLTIVASGLSVAVGDAASVEFSATGNAGPVTWSLLSETLPAEWGSALVTDSAGVASISTAAAVVPGEFSVRVRAVDSTRQPVEKTVSVTVAALPITISGTIDPWEVSVPVSDSLTVANGSGIYVSLTTVSGALPAGLTVGLASNLISFAGTPTTGGPWALTLRVTDSLGATGDVSLSGTVDEYVWEPLVATGGTVTDIDVGGRAYRVHVLADGEVLDVTDIGTDGTIERLLVGGGGAGGNTLSSSSNRSGPGGGGEVSIETVAVSIGTYTSVVGDGGAASSGNARGGDGSSSSLGALGTALGGGGGGGSDPADFDGADGGSGGGGGTSTGAGVGGSALATGHGDGGNGFSGNSTTRASGGGGGADGNGANATSATGGNGGPGITTTFTGVSLSFGGGGGGAANKTSGTPGVGTHGGGDGQGLGSAGSAGDAGTGGGGGGKTLTAGNSFPGGSGFVAARYPLDPP